MTTDEQLSSAFDEAGDALVADFAFVDFVRYLSEQVASGSGVQAVGIFLTDMNGVFTYVAASTEEPGLVNLFKDQTTEGPGFDCFHHGEQVINTDLSKAVARWPEFAPTAIAAGFSSAHAIPMRLEERVIGAMGVLDSAVGRFGEADTRVVQALADVATIAILEACTLRRAKMLTEQLQEALDSRVTIEQAKGALSRLRGVDIDQSFALMRTFARDNRRQLRDVAQAILTDPASVSTLTTADR